LFLYDKILKKLIFNQFFLHFFTIEPFELLFYECISRVWRALAENNYNYFLLPAAFADLRLINCGHFALWLPVCPKSLRSCHRL